MAALRKLLVMDDEPLVLEVVVAFATRMDFTAERVMDGEEAVEVYRKAYDEGHPFDLVILDLSIPAGVSGVQAAQRIRSIDPAAKLILSSGNPSDPAFIEYEVHGFSGVVDKPFTLSGFKACVDAVMSSGSVD